jgi:hypothetical protein
MDEMSDDDSILEMRTEIPEDDEEEEEDHE